MKNGRKEVFITAFCIIFLILISNSTKFAQETPSEPLKSGEDLIHPGDIIDVDIIGSIEYDWRGTITPEGFLQGLEFIQEPVYALCQSEEAVAEAVAKGYSNLLREPKVKVKILDRSKRPTSVIYGAIKNEQRFQIKRPVNLNEIIVFAGGFTEKTSGIIQILRPSNLSCAAANPQNQQSSNNPEQGEKYIPVSSNKNTSTFDIKITDLLKGDATANPQIFGGDIITVFSADPIYVTGGVVSPKQIATREKMTLTRAVSSAGGISKDADGSQVTIFRRKNGESSVIQANLGQIESGEAEDIVLEAFDVVDVGIKGRGKSKFAPIVRVLENDQKKQLNLPLRVIE